MSYNATQLIKIASNYSDLAISSLIVKAKKNEKKLNLKAKVRNRGTVCVPAEKAKDKKDHFPINDEGQARSALSRVEGLSSAPWYNGSLEGLRALVKRKVHAKYPGIGKDKKSSIEISDSLVLKYAQYHGDMGGEGDPNNATSIHGFTPSQQQMMNQPVNWNKLDPQKQTQKPASNPQIVQLQTNLNKMRLTGMDGQPLKVDGILGKNTRFAIQSFKQEYNMPQTPDEMAMYYIIYPGQNPNQRGYAGNQVEQQVASNTQASNLNPGY